MKKLAVLCITALGAALLVLGTGPAASAYPEQTCSVSVDHQAVSSGEKFTATGTASGVDAKNQPLPSSAFSWSFEWNGVTKHRTGANVTVSFRAPKVSQPRTITLTARASSSAGDCVRHIDITVTPTSTSTLVSAPGKGGSGSGSGAGSGHSTGGGSAGGAGHGQGHGFGLPNTGGPAFWILVAGLVLLLGGGGAVAASRRRHG